MMMTKQMEKIKKMLVFVNWKMNGEKQSKKYLRKKKIKKIIC